MKKTKFIILEAAYEHWDKVGDIYGPFDSKQEAKTLAEELLLERYSIYPLISSEEAVENHP